MGFGISRIEFIGCDTISMSWVNFRGGRQRNVFKGSDLVSALQERNPRRFRSRSAAYRFARKLFREGIIKSIFGASYFEDSAQLYMWQNDDLQPWRNMTSHPSGNRDHSDQLKSSSDTGLEYPRDYRLISDVRNRIRKEEDNLNLVNSIFRDLEREIEEAKNLKFVDNKQSNSAWTNNQRQSTSSESSVDVSAIPASRRRTRNLYTVNMTNLRDHDTIPEESHERASSVSMEYDLNAGIPPNIPSHTQSPGGVEDGSPRRWHDNQCPYSDNEKQLLDEMKRMKREHQHVLNTYEERINKLMAKMHELRSIAEMLENSSTKSSPYGILPKANLLNIIGAKLEQDKTTTSGHEPPPLPPRPGRGAVVYPNKPIIEPRVRMKQLIWTRIILKDAVGADGQEPSIWETMIEPKIATEELEKLFASTDVIHGEGASLYDDIIHKRGRTRQQLTSVFDTETSRRVMYSMRMLRCTLQEIISTTSSLDTVSSEINQDGYAELLESLGSSRYMEKIMSHVRRNGAGLLDHPEYLLFELSKVDHFRERIEFLRFRYRLQWHLFEIDQQMREVYTACDEIINSTALKNLLETLLAVGNYLNGGTQQGQADGYGLDILNTLKDIQDRDAKGNMLEFVLKMYCQFYEAEVEIGCPTRFRLPEASNMRHAAQVSFDGLQDRLNNLQSELKSTRTRLLDSLGTKNDDAPSGLGTQMENFYTSAVEVMSEQEKLLVETREVFRKTTYFFMHDSKCTSQEFFQIWATFLHDSKYYWRLAHRKLAKERFEHDFRYKGQMSSSSVTGFGNLRSSLIRRISSLRRQGDPRSNKDQQIKHINKWIESIDQPVPNEVVEQTPPVPVKRLEVRNTEQTALDQNVQAARCPSPKPLTSSPPSNNVLHRPMPKQATSPSSADNPVVLSNHNYENHSDLRGLTSPEKQDSVYDRKESNQRRAQIPLPSTDQSTKKPAQFSLKSWLKREQNRRSSNVDKTLDGQDQGKSKMNSGTFSKFRNTVMSRLSGNSETQRSSGRHARVDAWNLHHQQGATDSNFQTADANQRVSAPTEEISETITQDRVFNNLRAGTDHNSPVRSRNRSSSESPGRSSGRTDSRHSSDRLQSNTSMSPPNKVKEQQGDANHQAISKSQDFGAKMIPEVSANQFPHTELNNNAQSQARREHATGRLRAVTDSSSHPYSHGGEGKEHYERQPALKASEAKLTKANAVPIYKAKIVHNYENQTKWEVPKARRQQAGAINSGSSVDVLNKYTAGNLNIHTPNKPVISGSHTPGNMQIDKPHRDVRSNFSSLYGGNVNAGYSDKLSREGHVSGKSLENKEQSSSGPRAVTSLIERFEHSTPDSQQKLHSHTDADFQEQQVAMTSTPVTYRKELSLPPDSNANPPLPVRGDSQNPFPLLDPISNKISSTHGSVYQTPVNSHSRTNNYENSAPTNPIHRNAQGSTRFNENYNTPVSGNMVSGTAYHAQPAFKSNFNINTPPMKYNGNSRGNFSSPPGNQNSAGNNFRTTYGSETFVSPSDSNYNSPDLYSDSNRKLEVGHPDDGYSAQLRKAASSSRMDRYMKPSPAQGRPTNSVRSPPGPTAVVKPTILQKGDITFMEI